jgi:malonyl-CoA O-methyltransferase
MNVALIARKLNSRLFTKPFLVGEGEFLPLAEHRVAALAWVAKYSVKYPTGQGIAIDHVQCHKAYPEVTGYYIPTLLVHGQVARATEYAKWLLSIQNADGSWSAPGNGQPYVFDTGQILKGMVAIIPHMPEALNAAVRGAEWLLKNQRPDGSIGTPDQQAWSGEVPEAVHLYCLPPILQLAKLAKRPDFEEVVKRAVAFYLADNTLTDFWSISHFHAYIIEALIDLGENEQASEGLEKALKCRNADGIITAFAGKSWLCSTGQIQYALCAFKLGRTELGEKLLAPMLPYQHASGGFYGSYGGGAAYFPRAEISWPVKYFLDCLTELKIK